MSLRTSTWQTIPTIISFNLQSHRPHWFLQFLSQVLTFFRALVPDSNAVLHYVKSGMRRYHTFVATSVAVIHDGSESRQWRHVNVDMNPADNASRGLIGNIFLRQKMLVIGPEFLWKPKHMWPTQTEAFNSVCDEDPEVKKEVKAYFSSVGKLSSPLVDHF